MPMIKIEETDNKVVDRKPVAPGYYEVYVNAFDEPEVNGDFERGSILLKIRDDIEQNEKNRTLYVNLNTNPNIAWKLSNIATAAGIPAGTDFETLGDYFKALKGKSLRVVVAHRIYNDKVYADVKGFYPTREKPFTDESLEDSII